MKSYMTRLRRHPLSGPLVSILLILMVLFLFVLGCESLRQGNHHHEEDVLRQALDRDITACYALEGHYPESIAYLKEHYGLTYNEDRFLIDYTVQGANIRPSYLILQKGGE